MKKILTLLLVLASFASVKATVYNYPIANNNIVINNLTFGAALVAGDVVNIGARAGDIGYGEININELQCGVLNPDTLNLNQWIVIRFLPGAFLAPQAGDPVSSFEDGNYGVKIVGLNGRDRAQLFRHGGYAGLTGRSKYMWIDSFNFRYTGTFFTSDVTGTYTAFDGTLATAFHNWYLTNGSLDSSRGLTNGIAIQIGAQYGIGWWFDCVIRNVTFDHFYSTPGTSHYINVYRGFNVTVENCIFRNMGMVTTPVGHASVINCDFGKVDIHDNVFGPDNFGNDLRIQGSDAVLPGLSQYQGRSRFYNNLTINKRKYPVVENQTINGGTITDNAPWARGVSGPETWNNGVYNSAIGALNDPYIAAFYDNYASDVVTVKNNYGVMTRDVAWSSFKMINATYGTPTLWDTSNNRSAQFWPDIDIVDSVAFIPEVDGTLYRTGITSPAYRTADLYGNPISNPPDIGPIQQFVFIPPVGNNYNHPRGLIKIKIGS